MQLCEAVEGKTQQGLLPLRSRTPIAGETTTGQQCFTALVAQWIKFRSLATKPSTKVTMLIPTVLSIPATVDKG